MSPQSEPTARIIKVAAEMLTQLPTDEKRPTLKEMRGYRKVQVAWANELKRAVDEIRMASRLGL